MTMATAPALALFLTLPALAGDSTSTADAAGTETRPARRADNARAGAAGAEIARAERHVRAREYRAARAALRRALAASPGAVEARRAARRLTEVETLLGSGRFPGRDAAPRAKPARQAAGSPRPGAAQRQAKAAEPAVVAAPLPEARNRRDAAILGRLQGPVSFAFDGAPLRDVLDFLGAHAGITVILDPRADAAATPVTLRVNRMKMKDALNWVLRLSGGLAFAARDGALFISTPDRVRGKPVTVIYPVSDILYEVRDYPGPSLGIQGPEDLRGNGPAPESNLDSESLKRLLETVIEATEKR